MSEILLKIYEQVISGEDDTYRGRERIEKRVDELLRKYAADYGESETEAVKELAYAAALKAEQEGFQLGVRFALKVLWELHRES